MKKITLQEVKNAMKDIKFRLSLPPEFKEDIQKYEQNPGCACNLGVYKHIIKDASKQLKAYYGEDKEIEYIEEDLNKLAENHWSVINCTIHDLEAKLKALASGRKQIAIARYEDQITVIVNELDLIY